MPTPETCPICTTACPPRDQNPAFPFCSHRCQMIDLGRWLDGDYRIPGEPVNDIAVGADDEAAPWPGRDRH